MSKDNDGGPAFPQHDLSAYGLGPCGDGNTGMTLRDWFAGLALAGILAADNVVPVGTVDPKELLAKTAYGMADAMLKARDE